MNKFFQKVILLAKIIISVFLVYFIFYLYNSNSQLFSALLILFFIVLPTLFVFFLKDIVIKNFPNFNKIWKVLRIIYIIILIIFLALTLLGFYRLYDKNRTDKAIDFINSKKITLSDVIGQNLPPRPDQKINDSTVAGIDANNNFIRDDVELAIFEKYPNSAKIRSAALQYAQALQLQLVSIFNSTTRMEVIRKLIYGYGCVHEVKQNISSNNIIADDIIEEIERIVINTNIRKEVKSNIANRYSKDSLLTENIEYSIPSYRDEPCDINLSSFPN